jgi:hypothetical protein
MVTKKRNDLLAADQHMIDGVQKHLSNLTSMTVGSRVLSPADIIKVFEDRLATAKAAIAAEAARTAAVKANRDQRAQSARLVRAVRGVVQNMFLESPDTLADFGLAAPKAAKTTAAVKATAAAKAKATRVARGTLGKNQRKAVKGTATSEAITGPATGSSTYATPAGVVPAAPAAPSAPQNAPAPARPPTG